MSKQERRKVTARIPMEVFERLEKKRVKGGLTMSEIISRALSLYTVPFAPRGEPKTKPLDDLEHRSHCAQVGTFGGIKGMQELVDGAYSPIGKEELALSGQVASLSPASFPRKCHHCDCPEGETWIRMGRSMNGARSKRVLRVTPDVMGDRTVFTCNECDWLDDLEQLEEAKREMD